MLDIKILIIITFFSLIILVITSSLFWYKSPQKKYLKYFAFFSTFFLNGSIVTLMFLQNARERFKIFDNISALLFFTGVILFSIRTIKASTIDFPPNYLSTTDLMITLVYVYLFFMTIWLSVILIRTEIQTFLNK